MSNNGNDLNLCFVCSQDRNEHTANVGHNYVSTREAIAEADYHDGRAIPTYPSGADCTESNFVRTTRGE